MAEVYTGKIATPGDKIEEYFEILKTEEKKKVSFQQHLLELREQFFYFLEEKYSVRTANKHAGIVNLFMKFICSQTDVMDISEITKGMVNTHFRRWWKHKVLDRTTPEEIKIALKKFFRFLADKKGIVNEKVLKALE